MSLSFKDFITISEELHPEIKQILDKEDSPNNVLKNITSKIRDISRTSDVPSDATGIINHSSPKMGSSRAVFFPTSNKQVEIDGVKTSIPSAHKIAFNGLMDKHTDEKYVGTHDSGHKRLLGELQNEVESDHFLNSSYGVLKPENEGKYSYNPEGILATTINHHPDYHHTEMLRVEPLNAKDFTESTKNEDFPKGLKLKQTIDAIQDQWRIAQGHQKGALYNSQEEHDKIMEHPWVNNVMSFSYDSGVHPSDLAQRQLGMWTHPVTGKKHPVLIDFGFNSNVMKAYQNASKNKSKKANNRW